MLDIGEANREDNRESAVMTVDVSVSVIGDDGFVRNILQHMLMKVIQQCSSLLKSICLINQSCR